MKNLRYVLIALVCTILLASCTEENVKPHGGDGDPIGTPPPPPHPPGGGG